MKLPRSTAAVRLPIGLSLVVLCCFAQFPGGGGGFGGGFGGGGGGATDPGVQTAGRGTGGSIITTDPNGFQAFYLDGQKRFQAVESVSNASSAIRSQMVIDPSFWQPVTIPQKPYSAVKSHEDIRVFRPRLPGARPDFVQKMGSASVAPTRKGRLS